MEKTTELTGSVELQEVLEIFSKYLKSSGRKMTRQRQLIVESFLQSSGHVSTEELHQLTRKKDKKLGFVTVFRTLKALADCGIARKIDLNDGRSRFEHSYKRPHHHHIVCEECKTTIEFVSPEQERIQEEITSQYGFKPVRHTLQIFGICPECQMDRKPNQENFDSDQVFARDALKIAMDTERRGINFYQAASETVTQTSTKKVFLGMLREEEEHLSKLQAEWKRLISEDSSLSEAPVFLHFDYGELARIVPSRDQVRTQLEANLDTMDALEMAMKMEKEACQFFTRYAESFNDTKGRDIFLKFADEENEHYETIKQEFDLLSSDA
ncbi:MAG: transcriptional repressor [Acidobacteriota bacterium]